MVIHRPPMRDRHQTISARACDLPRPAEVKFERPSAARKFLCWLSFLFFCSCIFHLFLVSFCRSQLQRNEQISAAVVRDPVNGKRHGKGRAPALSRQKNETQVEMGEEDPEKQPCTQIDARTKSQLTNYRPESLRQQDGNDRTSK